MKVTITVDDFKCICGSKRFSLNTKDHLDKDCVMTCTVCFNDYRNDGAGDDGHLKIFRREPFFEEWLPDERFEKRLN